MVLFPKPLMLVISSISSIFPFLFLLLSVPASGFAYLLFTTLSLFDSSHPDRSPIFLHHIPIISRLIRPRSKSNMSSTETETRTAPAGDMEQEEISATALLAAPLTLPCGLVLPNRLVKCPMQETLAEPPFYDPPIPEFKNLYGKWAASKYGLLITGQVQIDIRCMLLLIDPFSTPIFIIICVLYIPMNGRLFVLDCVTSSCPPTLLAWKFQSLIVDTHSFVHRRRYRLPPRLPTTLPPLQMAHLGVHRSIRRNTLYRATRAPRPHVPRRCRFSSLHHVPTLSLLRARYRWHILH